MLNKRQNIGQSEVIGSLLTLAIVFLAAGLMGTFFLSSVGSNDPLPTGTVSYEMSIELVSTATGDESRYVMTIEAVTMERADKLELYYNSNTEVGTLEDEGDTEKIGESGTIEIQDGDTFTVVANKEGTRSIISEYTFREDAWLSANN
jgi:flagellin-like protein